MGRKKLSALKDVTNVVFNKTKSNPDIGVPEDETSDNTTDKMSKNTNKMSCSPSKRTWTDALIMLKLLALQMGGFR